MAMLDILFIALYISLFLHVVMIGVAVWRVAAVAGYRGLVLGPVSCRTGRVCSLGPSYTPGLDIGRSHSRGLRTIARSAPRRAKSALDTSARAVHRPLLV